MDYNTSLATSTSCQPASTPTAIILARNIQKFFQAKIDGKQHHSDLDVPSVLKDVDEILDSRSVEDGRLLLRGMVADLLKEVDLLRFRLDETSANLSAVKEERDVVNNDYRDRLLSLMLALQKEVGDKNHEIKQRFQDGKLLTADEATVLTIKALTNTIEQLNVENTQQSEKLAAARERMEDLESENEAKVHKITALEKQFCSINQKRHKVVTKLHGMTNALSDKENKSFVAVTPTNEKAKKKPFQSAAVHKPKPTRQARLVKLMDQF
jgi:predicted  nucleic acid-binding Zn-ribbon protein